MSASGSSTFGQLLRQTNFATLDPTISRVYTSTPSSVHKYGDWGLKRPIYRKKGPKHIKVTKLDAGNLLGSNWRSGESEARFMQAWGTGRMPWQDSDRKIKEETEGFGSLFSADYPPPAAEEEDKTLMADVNAMSPKQYKAYLKDLRAYRQNYLQQKLHNLRPETLQKLGLPEDRTLVNMSARGLVQKDDLHNFQTGITRYKLERASDRTLLSAPHETHGLSYSRTPSASPNTNPALYHRGRALDQATNQGYSSINRRASFSGPATNRPWTVSMGGVTVATDTSSARLSDNKARISQGVDFERDDREAGKGLFKVNSAVINTPPRVVDIDRRAQAMNIFHRRKQDPNPMSTFRFDIKVEYVEDDTPQLIADQGGKDWVGHVNQVPEGFGGSYMDDLGLSTSGRRKSSESEASKKSWKMRQDEEARSINSAKLARLLETIAKREPDASKSSKK